MILIPTHYSKEPRARYGDRALDDFYDEKLSVKKQSVEQPNETDIEQLNQHSDRHDSKSDHNVNDGKGAKNGEQERDGEIEEGTDDSGVVENVEDEDVVESETRMTKGPMSRSKIHSWHWSNSSKLQHLRLYGQSNRIKHGYQKRYVKWCCLMCRIPRLITSAGKFLGDFGLSVNKDPSSWTT